jgi:DNA-binding PadR family transcriptional regulator
MDSKAFHILVALAGAPKHGYAIRQEVEERTDGAVRLWPATLYGLLSELASEGWIEETESPSGAEDDARRRYYRMTPEGRTVLGAEAKRLEALAELARSELATGGAA